MAALALRPEISFVGVVLAVTAHAFERCACERLLGLMAVCARDCFVGAGQAKICKDMIESFSIKGDQLKVTTFVVSVT